MAQTEPTIHQPIKTGSGENMFQKLSFVILCIIIYSIYVFLFRI